MERRIGAILREARRRRRVELSEVETATRIRVRYLRAIEDEEWDALPGGVYTRGFIRTYASFLGLDGERLAAEYREGVEGVPRPGQDRTSGVLAGTSDRPRRAVPGLAWIAVAGVTLVAVIAIVAMPVGEDDGGSSQQPVAVRPATTVGTGEPARPPPSPAPGSLSLAAGAEVWVCLLDGAGRPLVNGRILEAGAEEGPFRSGSFTVSFGNGEVTMLIDGNEAEIPATPNPIGYSIDAEGELTRLSEAERPTCA